MDAVELKRLATEKGFHPIPVFLPEDDLPRLPRFSGTLDEFWTAAKALGAKAVFMSVAQMDESDFERLVPSDDIPSMDEDEEDDSFDGENYSVNLEKNLPSISRFRKHLGKDCAFVLIAKGGVGEIDYLLTETWWDEFHEEATKAVKVWAESRSEKSGEAEEEHRKKTDELLKLLRSLINDREFCLLRTHRAKIAYALEKIPDLEELGEFVLKPEIQKLADKIEAKGLNRKDKQ